MKGDNVKMNVLIQNANNRTPIFVFIHAKLQHCPLMIFFFLHMHLRGSAVIKKWNAKITHIEYLYGFYLTNLFNHELI